MNELLNNLGGLVVALGGGGALFTAALALLTRHDKRSDRQVHINRMYELAYRRSDSWGRQLAQIAGPLAIAHREGKEDLRDSLLELLASYLGGPTEKGYCLRPHPDFLGEAREELDLVNGEDE